jgi:hypothetical protein
MKGILEPNQQNDWCQNHKVLTYYINGYKVYYYVLCLYVLVWVYEEFLHL